MRWFALAGCVWFLLWGLLWVTEVGIQTDEALFSAGVYGPIASNFVLRVAGVKLPLMTMTYVGTVKSWLYRPILAVWKPSAASLRVPVIFLGALTIGLFACLLRYCSNSTAAVFGTLLLASDPLYLLTTRFDWGPVAVQHFCFVGALLLLVRFHRVPRARYLCGGFALLGLGLWDKATFVWLLTAIGVAGFIVFPRLLLRHVRPRTVALACASFLLGAAPLLVFNIREHWVTFHSNAHFSSGDLRGKAALLKETLQGAGQFGAILREDGEEPQIAGRTALQRALVVFNTFVQKPRASLQLGLFLASLAGLPFLWNTPLLRPALFSLTAFLTGWCMMAFTRDAGSTHHIILLWPLPQMFMATVLSGLLSLRPRILKPAAILICAAVCISNSLVATTYYAQQIQNGGSWAWSDAFYGLSNALKAQEPGRICLLDWGFWDNLRFLHEGRLALQALDLPATEDDKKRLVAIFADSNTRFVSYTEGNEAVPGRAQAFVDFAVLRGYRKHNVKVFRDRNGRAVIELFNLEPERP